LKLLKHEKTALLAAALCAAAAVTVTAACRTPASTALVFSPLAVSAAPAEGPAAARVDLNTASAAELDALPGIGAKLAQRIVDYRAANGNFRCAEDVMKVPGIGAGKFEKIKASITVEGENGT